MKEHGTTQPVAHIPEHPEHNEGHDRLNVVRKQVIDLITEDYKNGAIQRALFGMVSHPDQQIEDAVHDVVAALIRSKGQSNDIDRLNVLSRGIPPQYYKSVFFHLQIDRQRIKGHQIAARGSDINYGNIETRIADPSSHRSYDTAEYLMDVERFLDHIPDDTRGKRFRIVLFGIFAGKKNQTIAAELGVTPARLSQLWGEFAKKYKRILPKDFPHSIKEFKERAGMFEESSQEQQEREDHRIRDIVLQLFVLHEQPENIQGLDKKIVQGCIEYVLSVGSKKTDLEQRMKILLGISGQYSLQNSRTWMKLALLLKKYLNMAEPIPFFKIRGFIMRHPEFSFSARRKST